jgi:FMN hydrolase / 5-amino-6-(5-phospho-D-ribitylamino)uracil phosphatase
MGAEIGRGALQKRARELGHCSGESPLKASAEVPKHWPVLGAHRACWAVLRRRPSRVQTRLKLIAMNLAPLALTLDLDDTLWPIAPTIARAEVLLQQWLREHAPATAQRFGGAALQALRSEVARAYPEWGHDLGRLRLQTLRQALQSAGDDPALAEPAFEVFFEARQQVHFYADVLPALHRLAARFPLLALTNGNADLAKVGLQGVFTGCISARQVGVAKPDVRIFHAACAHLALPPERVLHIGDDLALDVAGATNAGLGAVWLRRAESLHAEVAAPCRVFADLNAMADHLLNE